MKLYVWDSEDVLTDYTSGMIVALGEDLEGALKAIREECSFCMDSFPNDKPTFVIDLSGEIRPQAWLSWGGG